MFWTLERVIKESKIVYDENIKKLEYNLYNYARDGKTCFDFLVEKDFVPLVEKHLKQYDVKVTVEPDYGELWWNSSKEQLYTHCIFTVNVMDSSMFLEEPFITIIENNLEEDLQKEFKENLENVQKSMYNSAINSHTYCDVRLKKEIGDKIKLFLEQEGLCVEEVYTIPACEIAYFEEVCLRINWTHLI